MRYKFLLKIILVFSFILLLSLFGCNNNITIVTTTEELTTETTTKNQTTTEKKLIEIEIDETSLETYYDVFDLDLSEIDIELLFSDDSTSIIPLSSKYFSTADLDLLGQVGAHTVLDNYQEFAVELTITLRNLNVYRVTFKDYNNYITNVQFVLHGESANAPNIPVREGYVFKGWDIAFDFITNDLTVHALYSPVLYSVDFETNGGNDCAPVEGIIINSQISLPIPSKKGYIFLGWFLGNDVEDQQFYSTSLVKGNLTLSAH
jgi:hypothetical protein